MNEPALKERIIVCGIVVNAADEVLLGKKPPGTLPYPDTWLTLGGGVEDLIRAQQLVRQGFYDAPYLHSELRREVREEAGIEISAISCICPLYRAKPREAVVQKKDGKYRLIFLEYLCRAETTTTRPNLEIVEFTWAAKQKLDEMPLSLPSRELYRDDLRWIPPQPL